MSDVEQPDVRARVRGLVEEPDGAGVPRANEAEDYSGAEPAVVTLMSDAIDYTVNLTTGRVHKRLRVGDTHADFPQCNLDQITDHADVGSREEVAALFWPDHPTPGRRTPKACKRCFGGPTAEPVGEPVAEGEGGDPEAETVTVEEMDPEDRP